MTPKQERFVQEYMLDLNATQAAIRAGYSAHTADVQGPRLLGNVGVAAAIQAAQAEFRERMEVSKESVTAQLNTAYDMADPDAKMAAKFAYMARRYPDLFGELKLLMGRVFLATKATFDEVKADTVYAWRGAAEKFERDRAAPELVPKCAPERGGSTSDLEKNIRAYEAMEADLFKHHTGQWVVIHDRKLVGTFGTLDAAAAEALQRFGRGPYLIRQVTIAPLFTTADVNALQIGAKI